MSRQFTNQLGEGIVVSPGGLADADGGPITIACLWKPLNFGNYGLIHARHLVSGEVWAIVPAGTATIIYGNTAGFRTSSPTVYNPVGLPWRIDVWSKANGSAIARFHFYLFSGAGSLVWSHADKGAALGDGTGVVQEIRLGHYDDNEALNGRIGAIGVWKSVLSDGDIETLHDALSHWMSLNPDALWKFNTDDVVSGTLDVTGNGANETSHSLTTFSSDEPSPFDYTLTSPPTISFKSLRTYRKQRMLRMRSQ